MNVAGTGPRMTPNRLWLWTMLLFALLPASFVLILPALSAIEVLDIVLFLLLQPQGQLFALFTGKTDPGSMALVVATVLYALAGGIVGKYGQRYGSSHPILTVIAGLFAWESLLFATAIVCTVSGLMDIT